MNFKLYFIFLLIDIGVQSNCKSQKNNLTPTLIFDQHQSGKYNIQVNVKDVTIIEVEKNEFRDINGDLDEYYYDESDFTIKPWFSTKNYSTVDKSSTSLLTTASTTTMMIPILNTSSISTTTALLSSSSAESVLTTTVQPSIELMNIFQMNLTTTQNHTNSSFLDDYHNSYNRNKSENDEISKHSIIMEPILIPKIRNQYQFDDTYLQKSQNDLPRKQFLIKTIGNTRSVNNNNKRKMSTVSNSINKNRKRSILLRKLFSALSNLLN